MGKMWGKKYLFSVLTALLVLALSVLPSDVVSASTGGISFPGMDKLIHGIMYASLSGIIHLEYFRTRSARMRSVFSIILLVWSYSILMELIQWLVIDSRMGEIADALANLAGIVIASGLYMSFKTRKRQI